MLSERKKLLAVSLTVLILFSTFTLSFRSVEASDVTWEDPDRAVDGVGEYLLVVDEPVDKSTGNITEGVVVLWHMNHAYFRDHGIISEFWYESEDYTEQEAIHMAVDRAEEYNDNRWGSMNIYLSSTGEELASSQTFLESIISRLQDLLLSIPETVVNLFVEAFDAVTKYMIGYDFETDFAAEYGQEYEDYGGIRGPEHPGYEYDEWHGVAGFVQYTIPESVGMFVLPITGMILIMSLWVVLMAIKWIIEYIPIL